MPRYQLRITDAPCQPSRLYDAGDDLTAAVDDCRATAASGYIGGTVDVIDTTIGHPDHNVVHTETRAT